MSSINLFIQQIDGAFDTSDRQTGFLPSWTVSSALQDTDPAKFLAVQV